MKVEFTRQGLEAVGFAGFEAVATLRGRRCSGVPGGPGVYAVLTPGEEPPDFLESSRGGHFKGKDPTVPISTLAANWVAGTPVLYIGKADSLIERIDQLLRFGGGQPIGHWGGRYLWQVAGSGSLLVAWATDPQPLAAERALLRAFHRRYGTLPFANLRF